MSQDGNNDGTRAPSQQAGAGEPSIIEVDPMAAEYPPGHSVSADAQSAPLSRPPPKPSSRPPGPNPRAQVSSVPPRPAPRGATAQSSLKPLRMISLGGGEAPRSRPPSAMERISSVPPVPPHREPARAFAEPADEPAVLPPPKPPEFVAPPPGMDEHAAETPLREQMPSMELPTAPRGFDPPTPPADEPRPPMDSNIDLDRVTPEPQPTRRSPPPPPSSMRPEADAPGPDIEVGSAEIDVSFDSAPGDALRDAVATGSDAPPPSDEEAIPVSETEPLVGEASAERAALQASAALPPPAPPPPLTPMGTAPPARSRPPAPSAQAAAAGADVMQPPSLDDSGERSLRKPPPPPPKRGRPSAPPSEHAVAKALEAPRFEPPTKPRAKPWWEELFTDDFGRGILPLTESQIKREVNFIEDSLGVAKGGVVLDLGCGSGNHATELSSRGYGVVGFDLSLPQLATAGEYAQERGQKINFLQGDMRDMSFDEVFDGIYCWNTSFGYFEEEKNVAVAERVFKALRPGGSFLLDVINRDFVVEHQPSQVWFEGDACVCMDDMSVDFITSRLRVKRTMMLDDGRTRECTFSIRVYSLHELGKMLHEIGFRVTEASGHIAYPGVFFGATSPRVVILAQKP